MRYAAKVVPGRGEGQKLGFPTLNLEIPAGFDAAHGIYAAWTWSEGERLPSALHYGPVPVFGITKASLEIHVIGRNIASPPTEISFELVKYLRKIKHFEDLESLKAQMQEDVREALAALK